MYRTVREGDNDVQFLHYDRQEQEAIEEDEEEEDEGRVLVFATDTMLGVLGAASHWMVDGTFKVAPRLFSQLLIIHGIFHGHVIPCVYAVLPSKSQDQYQTVFRVIRTAIGRERAPSTIVMDLELSLHNDARQTWPDVDIQGCFFHLSQAVWRQCQELGLSSAYVQHEEIRNAVKNLPAIAFLRAQDVPQVFDNLLEDLPDNNGLKELYAYFERTSVGRKPEKTKILNPAVECKGENERGNSQNK